MQPLVLYGHGRTPNPIKVGILLEELQLPYTIKDVEMKDVKSEPYTLLNPNGRLPSVEDPNTGIKLFESGAIFEYLVETYDKENRLQYTTPQEKWISKSWLHLQTSGQGPYFGQIPFFNMFHHEKVTPSVIERFQKEVKRVSGVVELQLKRSGKPYLIGDKVTYADLAFIPWFNMVKSFLTPDWDYASELPLFNAWLEKLLERPSVKTIYGKEEFQHKG